MRESNKPVILDVRGVTKTFYYRSEPYKSIKKVVIDFLKRRDEQVVQLKALDNLSFSIQKGESVGLVGRNGAGKSTLLKLLAKILIPDSGEIKCYGSLAPLIELGAGFHPEFTGLQNIYLNGLILGLKKTEIKERLDWIVEFSELGDFINRPLKCYSSGMQMRLGFSIAASLNPDVFLIDESLSVGDYKFVQKCYSRLKDIQAKGCSFLIASHDLEALKSLTSRCLVLHQGCLVLDSDTQTAIDTYLNLDSFLQQKSLQLVGG